MLRIYPTPAVEIDVDDAYRADRLSDRPWVMVNMVASLDGATAVKGRSGPLGGSADKAVFHAIRAVPDIILVGSGTATAERYGPPAADVSTQERRGSHGVWPVARIAVVSGSLNINFELRLFSEPTSRPLVVTHSGADPGRLAEAERHADVIVAGDDQVDLGVALLRLGELGARVVLCEGGPRLNGTLVEAGLVDELCLSVAPLLAGGESRRIVEGSPADPPLGFELAHVFAADGYLFLRYVRASRD